jgi:hypothetical protein
MPISTSSNTFDCLCCHCEQVRQLIDCCTDEPVDKAVCSTIAADAFRSGDRCYYLSDTDTPFATAVSNGWDILPLSAIIFPPEGSGSCVDEQCYKYWQVLLPVCGNSDIDWQSPAGQLAGPCDTPPATSGYAQIGGRWYYIEGYRTQRLCDPDFTGGHGDYGGGIEYFEIISSTCFEDEGDPYECCGRCFDHTGLRFEGTAYEETIDFDSYTVLPCCLQISGMSFSGCGTPTGTDWDGKLTANTGSYANAYVQAQSYPDDNCIGNWDTCNGYVPGTTTGLPGGNVLYWDCDDGKWYIDLAFVSYEKTGTISDPTGTYTRIGAGSCSAPATLSVSAI